MSGKPAADTSERLVIDDAQSARIRRFARAYGLDTDAARERLLTYALRNYEEVVE